MTKIKNTLKHNFYLKAFLLGFLTAFCLFIPFLVVDKGFFTYAGDFDSQQIPFYMYMVRMVQFKMGLGNRLGLFGNHKLLLLPFRFPLLLACMPVSLQGNTLPYAIFAYA